MLGKSARRTDVQQAQLAQRPAGLLPLLVGEGAVLVARQYYGSLPRCGWLIRPGSGWLNDRRRSAKDDAADSTLGAERPYLAEWRERGW